MTPQGSFFVQNRNILWVAAYHKRRILVSLPEASGLILGVSKNFSLDVAEIY